MRNCCLFLFLKSINLILLTPKLFKYSHTFYFQQHTMYINNNIWISNIYAQFVSQL